MTTPDTIKESEFPRANAAAYVRMSTEHQQYSTSNQMDAIREYGQLAESEQRRIVYLMTYHSAKGLDFETVFLPGLNGGQPLYPRDPALEPRLFYVATTRSRRLLNLSYSSPEPHSLVRGMPMNLIDRIEISQQAQGSSDADDLSNLF